MSLLLYYIKVPRTLIGIKTLPKGEQEAHIFIVTNEHPMTIYEARDLCAKHGLDSAMAFDGGSSTSLDYKRYMLYQLKSPVILEEH